MEASPSFATKQAVRLFFAFLFLATTLASAQDWVRTGTNLGAQKIRLAAADFKLVGNDPALSSAQLTFNQVLFSDLNNAGIFDMVSKSMAPAVTPGSPLRDQSHPVEFAAGQRRDGRFRRHRSAEWPGHCERLAVRREEHSISPGPRPTLCGSADAGYSSPHRS